MNQSPPSQAVSHLNSRSPASWPGKKKGEFINFNSLVHEAMSPNPSSPAKSTLQLNPSGAGFMVTARPPTKKKVCDLASWLESFLRYMAVVVEDRPDHLGEFLVYADIIHDFARSYHPR